MDISKYTISIDSTVLDAMKKIELNNHGFVVVLDSNLVFGTLTDGDIRRALINNAKLNSSVREITSTSFEFIYPTATFDKIVEKFRSSKIRFLPIKNLDGTLKDILTKEQLHRILLKGEKLELSKEITVDINQNNSFDIFNRPWGFYKTFFLSDFVQAKMIQVFPNQQLSLQYHNYREEHWVVIKGEGLMTIGQSLKNVSSGNYIFIPKGCQHRIKNISKTEPLIISEVQLGTYFGEDDIIRIEDDYGRLSLV